MKTIDIIVNEIKREVKKDVEYLRVPKDLEEVMEGKYMIDCENKYNVDFLTFVNDWKDIVCNKYNATFEEQQEVTSKINKWSNKIQDNRAL